MLSVESPVGRAYLDTVTALLQRRRLANPRGEVWEAADLQWWWPRDQHADPADARFWVDDAGQPVAGTVFTHWGADRVGCDVLADADFAPAWEFATERARHLGDVRVELAIPEGEVELEAAAGRAGFAPSEEAYAVSWLDPADLRAPRHDLPSGYRIVPRSADRSRPHPMSARNGARVEDALTQCSLYDPDLDLAVLAPDGAVAGYALFWPDPVTGVGLVEPMRVEDEHAGRGLARHLLDAGLRGLAAAGCTRLKVSMEPANTAAVRLYTGAGFVVTGRDRTWHSTG